MPCIDAVPQRTRQQMAFDELVISASRRFQDVSIDRQNRIIETVDFAIQVIDYGKYLGYHMILKRSGHECVAKSEHSIPEHVLKEIAIRL